MLYYYCYFLLLVIPLDCTKSTCYMKTILNFVPWSGGVVDLSRSDLMFFRSLNAIDKECATEFFLRIHGRYNNS